MQAEPNLEDALTEMVPDLVKKSNKRSFTKNLLKMDNKGFSTICWDNLHKYGGLEGTFPAAAKFVGQNSYLSYMDDLLRRADATYPHKNRDYSMLMIGGALWPAVEAELKHGSLDRSINKVLDIQMQIFDYSMNSLREKLVALFHHEYLLTHRSMIDNMQEFCTSDYFAPALEILRSRSLTNKTVTENLKFFEKMALHYRQ